MVLRHPERPMVVVRSPVHRELPTPLGPAQRRRAPARARDRRAPAPGPRALGCGRVLAPLRGVVVPDTRGLVPGGGVLPRARGPRATGPPPRNRGRRHSPRRDPRGPMVGSRGRPPSPRHPRRPCRNRGSPQPAPPELLRHLRGPHRPRRPRRVPSSCRRCAPTAVTLPPRRSRTPLRRRVPAAVRREDRWWPIGGSRQPPGRRSSLTVRGPIRGHPSDCRCCRGRGVRGPRRGTSSRHAPSARSIWTDPPPCNPERWPVPSRRVGYPLRRSTASSSP